MENGTDFAPGDPATHVLGRPEEKPAREHAPLPPKPKIVNADTIQHDIEVRIDEIKPRIAELEALQEELKVLEKTLPALQGITTKEKK